MARSCSILSLLVICLVLGCNQKSPEALAPPDNSRKEADRDTTARQVQADVRRMSTALYGGDVETVLKFTNPQVIQRLGGLDKARTVLKGASEKMQTSEMKLESLEFPAPPTFTNGMAHEFVVVPTKSLVTVKGQQIESLNYQFGVRELAETNWTYIEGSRVTTTNVHIFFPDFPKDFEFPQAYRKKL